MFKNTIKKERLRLKLTQEQLANKLGINRSNVANWEHGSNTAGPEMIIKLAEVFDCSTDYLLGKSKYRNFKECYETITSSNEFKNQENVLNKVDDDTKKELNLETYYDDVNDKFYNSNGIELKKDLESIFIDKLKELKLIDDSKVMSEKEINVVLNFIEHNKDMLKILIEQEINKK